MLMELRERKYEEGINGSGTRKRESERRGWEVGGNHDLVEQTTTKVFQGNEGEHVSTPKWKNFKKIWWVEITQEFLDTIKLWIVNSTIKICYCQIRDMNLN